MNKAGRRKRLFTQGFPLRRRAAGSCRASDDDRRPGRGRGGVEHAACCPALRFRQVSADYRGVPALEQVTLSLAAGKRLAVVGPNGAGKSTFLALAAGLLAPTDGTIEVFGHAPLAHLCISYLPQRATVDWRFPVTVFDVVLMGRSGRLGLLRRPSRADRQVARDALATVGIADLAMRRIEELSGGQQQRMFIARALAQQAELVLMDEPLAALDVHSVTGILELIDELADRGATPVVALHDLGVAGQRFDQVLLLDRHVIGYGPAEDVLSPERLRQAYGSCLRMIETEEGVLMIQDTACSGGHINELP